jgi:hypothetical protein
MPVFTGLDGKIIAALNSNLFLSLYGTGTNYIAYDNGIQYIIDKAQQIEIDRRRMVGQSVSRSQRIKTAERSTGQPWKFKVTPPAQMSWTVGRMVTENITNNDRVEEYTISLSNNPKMGYITAYQGQMTQAEIDGLTIQAQGTSTLTLTTLPSVSSSTVLFAPGDIIQPDNSRYPYSVTDYVFRGINTVTNVSLNRPVITSENITLAGNGVKVGNSATWQMVVTGLPTYSLIPMKQVQYTGDFELIEKII